MSAGAGAADRRAGPSAAIFPSDSRDSSIMMVTGPIGTEGRDDA